MSTEAGADRAALEVDQLVVNALVLAGRAEHTWLEHHYTHLGGQLEYEFDVASGVALLDCRAVKTRSLGQRMLGPLAVARG